MPLNSLTSAQLQQLMQMYQQGNFTNGAALDNSGMLYSPNVIQHQGEDAGQNQLLGFTGYDPNNLKPGDALYQYDPTGSGYTKQAVQNGGSTADLLKSSFKDLAPVAGMVGAGIGLSGLLGGAGFGSLFGGGASSGLGAEVDPMMYGGSGAGTWGAGDAMAAAGGAGGASGGAGGAGGALSPNTAVMGAGPGLGGGAPGAYTTAAADSQAANAALGLGPESGSIPSVTVNGAAGGATGGGGLFGGVGNAVKSLLPSGLGGFGSMLPALLGAAVGSRPQTTTETASKNPWGPLVPYLTGSEGHPGLFNSTQSLMEQQLSPQGQQGFDAMKSAGMGLMSRQPMGNGFNAFFGQPHQTGFGGYPTAPQVSNNGLGFMPMPAPRAFTY